MKHEHRFTVIIEPCEEGGYFVDCPTLPGCHVQGETYEETIAEMMTAIDAMISDYVADDEPIPNEVQTI